MDTKFDSWKVVLGSGEPGTRNWHAGNVVLVDEVIADYVRRQMGRREIDREVLSAAARWLVEIDRVMQEAEEMGMREEMKDFLQMLPKEVC